MQKNEVIDYITSNQNLDELALLKDLITRQIIRKIFTEIKAGTVISFKGHGKDGLLNGKVTKINEKTVSVHADDGSRWRVPFELIQEVK